MHKVETSLRYRIGNGSLYYVWIDVTNSYDKSFSRAEKMKEELDSKILDILEVVEDPRFPQPVIEVDEGNRRKGMLTIKYERLRARVENVSEVLEERGFVK